MPRSRQGEHREDYISRCMGSSEAVADHPHADQRYIVCQALWEDSRKRAGDMTIHQKLIEAVLARKGRGLRFGQGIWTADRYVKTVAECIGPGMCQRYFGGAQQNFPGVMKEAAVKLSFAGDGLVIEHGKLATNSSLIKKLLGDDELPEHTMLAFPHVLTTTREDRDGDILETKGAVLDSILPMLWQHVHTLPIGRYVKTLQHTDDVLRLLSVLLDMNELTHDAGILVEAKALRFSHGFRALDFSERNKEAAGSNGFRVKSFEIMEESLVSVPSNVDAEIELFSRKKLKSEVFKAHAKFLWNAVRAKSRSVPGVSVTLKADSPENLKQAAGMLGLPAPDGEHGHKHDCNCGGKCGKCGDGKAQKADTAAPQGDTHEWDFATAQEADDAAFKMNCRGHHRWAKGDGTIVYRPCESAHDFVNVAGGKGAAGDAKAQIQRTDFDNQTEAEQMAEVLGCDSFHMTMGAAGKITYRPCRTPQELATYLPSASAPTLPKPSLTTAGAAPAAKGEKAVAVKMWMDGSSLQGSYFNRINSLNEDARRFLMGAGMDVDPYDGVSVWALFDGYGIIAVCENSYGPMGSGDEDYYRADWSESDGGPKWTGTPSEVEVAANIEISEAGKAHLSKLLEKLGKIVEPENKAGKVISMANMKKLKEVHDDLDELAGMEIPRAAKALAGQCRSAVKGIMDDASSDGEASIGDFKTKTPAAREAAAILLESGDEALLVRTKEVIEAMLRVKRSDSKVQKLKHLLRR